MAADNTFAATALSSYGGYWISLGIVLTPGGFHIQEAYSDPVEYSHAFGLFLMDQSSREKPNINVSQGWFIFTFLLWLLTLLPPSCSAPYSSASGGVF
ncbi:Meiotically up-regulated protein 86 protein [Clarireedia jacksonii]